MNLPPWLQINPQDFLKAMQAGTAAGEAAARTAQAQWEAEQRLKLEEQRIEAARQHAEIQAEYWKNQYGLGKDRLSQSDAHHKDLLKHQSDVLDLEQRQAKERAEMAQKNYELHREALKRRTVPKSPLEQFEIADTKSKLKEAQKALESLPIDEPHKVLGGLWTTSGNLAQRQAKQKAIDELRGKLSAFGPTGAPSGDEADTTEEAPKLRFIRSDDGTFIPAQ